MKSYVHIEKNFASLDECNYIINNFGPKCKEHLYSRGAQKGQTFPYLGHFFNDDEIITINSGEFNLDNLIRESINTGRGSLVNISHSIYNNFYSLLLSE